MITALAKVDRQALNDQINEKGYGQVKSVLSAEECEYFINAFEQDELFRKTVIMERHNYGKGRYRYFQHPLPEPLQALRNNIYDWLAPLANQWTGALKLPIRYPESHEAFLQQCAEQGQKLATPLVLKYEKGGFNTLHQDLYGEVYFPMQAIFCLNKQNEDFTGGSLVLTEQQPRAQSRAMVINPEQGDMIVIPTQFRPKQGTSGHYRLNMRHGVSEVLSGTRYTMGIILHDALK